MYRCQRVSRACIAAVACGLLLAACGEGSIARNGPAAVTATPTLCSYPEPGDRQLKPGETYTPIVIRMPCVATPTPYFPHGTPTPTP